MSTKTNDPKQTAPETAPAAEDVKADTAAKTEETEGAPVKKAEKKADKKEAKKEKEPKEKKETKKEIEADLAAEKDKYLRLLAEYDNYRRRSTREREAIYADVRCDTLKSSCRCTTVCPALWRRPRQTIPPARALRGS